MSVQKADLHWFCESVRINPRRRKSKIPISFARTLSSGEPSFEEIEYFNATEFDIEKGWKQINKRSQKCFDACLYIRCVFTRFEEPDPRFIEIMFERFSRKAIFRLHHENHHYNHYTRFLMDNFILKRYLIHCRKKPKPSVDVRIFKSFMNVCMYGQLKNDWTAYGCNLVFETLYFWGHRSGPKMMEFLVNNQFKLLTMPDRNLFGEVYTIDFNEEISNNWLSTLLFFAEEKTIFQSRVTVGRINSSNIDSIKFTSLRTVGEMRYFYAYLILVRQTNIIELSLYQRVMLMLTKTRNDEIVSGVSPLPWQIKQHICHFFNFHQILPGSVDKPIFI